MLQTNIFASVLIVSITAILLFRKGNSLPNKILAITLFVPALNFMDNILILKGYILVFPWAYFFVQTTAALFAPLSYYYIVLMTGNKAPRSFKWLSSITGLIIVWGVVMAVRFGLMDAAGRGNYMTGVLEGPYPDDMLLYSGFLFIHQLVYFTSNAVQVWKFRKEMMHRLSNIDNAKLSYLFNFVLLLWILTFITIVLYAAVETVYVEYIVLPIVLVVIIFFILYNAFSEHAFFTEHEYMEHLKMVVDTTVADKKENGSIQIEDKMLFVELTRHIDEKEPFKNPDFNIEMLSAELAVPVYKLTDCLKLNGTTFYELIRKKRVEKAKELLSNHDYQYTIEATAYEVGFRSRASFYRAFRKYEDSDPSSLLNS